MKRRHGSTLLVLAALAGIFGLAPPASADTTLSRAQVLRSVMAQSPEVAAARARVAAAWAQRRQADAARWPNVDLTAGVGTSLQASLVPGTAVQSTENAYSDVHLGDLSAVFLGDLHVAQPLYTFGKIDERRAAALHGIRARRAQVRMTRDDVGVRVARIYEGWLLARDSQRFFEEMGQHLDKVITETRERLAHGATERHGGRSVALRDRPQPGRGGLARGAGRA